MKRAMDLNWSEINFFNAEEWPSGTLPHMSARLIYVLDEIRAKLPKGHTMQPSGLAEAHVRHTHGNSRHETKGGTRLSDATDVFMQWNTVWAAWLEAQRHPEVGGLGIYFDSITGRPFMHIDLRPERMLWVRHEGKYTYFHHNPIAFFKVLAEHGRS